MFINTPLISNPLFPEVSKNVQDATGSTRSDNGFGNFWQGLGNQFTGNLDYERQLDVLNKQNEFSASEAEKTRKYNAEQALLQREFEERMSNSAISRQMADLKNAGLNPALVAGLSGSSTPVGSTASAQSAHSASSASQKSGQGYSMLLNSIISLISLGASMNANSAKNAMTANINQNKLAFAKEKHDIDTAVSMDKYALNRKEFKRKYDR